MEMDLNWLSSKINTAVQIHVNKILVLKEHIFQSNTTKFFFNTIVFPNLYSFQKLAFALALYIVGCRGVVQLEGLILDYPWEVPLRLRLVSLFYLLKIPLKLKIKTKYKSCFGVNKILDLKNAQTLI